MSELWDSIKSWTIKIIAGFIIITLVVLVIFGPIPAANFVGWCGDKVSEGVSNLKILAEEIQKRF